MGITKQYLRWRAGEKFGVIGSSCSAIQWIDQWPTASENKRICATAACEDIVFWDTKTGQQIFRFDVNDENQDGQNPLEISMISCMAYNGESMIICSGHHNGCIRVYNCHEQQLKTIFSGHRGTVNCLTFDSKGLRLATGGKDTEIVLWDLVNHSGLFRLKGHKGPVNRIEFMREHPWILVSASSDTFIKLWNLDTQHCFRTIVGHRTEIWSFIIIRNDTEIISGGSDSELKVWKLIYSNDDQQELFQQKSKELHEKRLKRLQLLGEEAMNEDLEDPIDDDEDNQMILVENFGTILRKSMEKLITITCDPTEQLMLCHGKDNFVELFRLRNDEEIASKLKKRLRKEKKRQLNDTNEESNDATNNDQQQTATISDEIERLDVVKSIAKIRSIDIRFLRKTADNQQEYLLAILLMNNQLEFQQLTLKAMMKLSTKQLSVINMMGHRNDVRSVAISSDSQSILTASADSIKLWNKSSCRCMNTITSDEFNSLEYPLCIVFVPGNKHAITGTKNGKIQIISLTAAQIQSTIDDVSEENKPIWSLNLLPDLTGIVTGCEDKLVKFWSFNLVDSEDNDQSSKILTLNHDRTLEVDEGVICTRISPNSKFIAVAMLDSCVKIYFMDTFKFFLSLYGHKLPVLCMDISDDNRLIVTGSSDKNIKIWGMDFGDCHRSIFAHDDNILALQFIPKTHQFFTASKDKLIKMWDADTFEMITVLNGHHNEIWSIAVSPNGKYLLSVSHDKSIRLWYKTNEPLILHEEKELLNEKEFLKDQIGEQHTLIAGELPSTDAASESARAQKKTIDTIRNVERLIESIDIYYEEIDKLNRYDQQMQHYESNNNKTIDRPKREPCNPNLLIYRTECPYRFMLEILTRIPSNEMEEILLQLPFYHIRRLLQILSELLERRWEIELVSRCICYLIRVNFGQITSSNNSDDNDGLSMVKLIDKIRKQMHSSIESIIDLSGVNLAALKYYENVFESKSDISLFTEILYENRMKSSNNNKRKKRIVQAPILTWN